MFFKPAERTKNIQHAIRDVAIEAKKLERSGKKIYYLNIGDPLKFDFRTPKHLWDAVNKRREEGESYAPSEGVLEAREAIVRDLERKGMKDVEIENTMIGSGVSELIWFSLGAIANPGENVLVPRPTYSLYTAAMNYLGIETNYYDLNEENNWMPDTEDMRKKVNDKTKAIVLINPNNPTGSNSDKRTLKEIANIAGENKLVVLADEIYDKLLLENESHYCFGSIAHDIPVLVMNGLSKNYLATGFRIGWIAANKCLAEDSALMGAIHQLGRTRLSAPHPFQYAVRPALEGSQDHLSKTVKKLKERQKFTHEKLNEINGLSCVKPRAAFYAFPRIELDIEDDKKFVMELLKEEGVCVVHGSGFGQKPGTKHFRMVFLPQIEILSEAFDRIERFIRKRY